MRPIHKPVFTPLSRPVLAMPVLAPILAIALVVSGGAQAQDFGGLARTAMAPKAASAGGGGLGSIFGCSAPGGKQLGGAAAGGLIGGLAGNLLLKKSKTIGTLVGAGAGAAVGSWVGCKLQRNDQAKMEQATTSALNNGGTGSWTNPETGASGQVRVIETRPLAPVATAARPSMQGLRLAPDVELASAYTAAPARLVASSTVILRASPNWQGRDLGRIGKGQTVEVLGAVEGSPWYLIGENGRGVGYVASGLLTQPAATTLARKDDGCRIVQQTVNLSGGERQSQQYRACKTGNGEWQFTSLNG